MADEEFDLHVWKRCDVNGERDLYTIGVWDGDQIRSLCHITPIDSALAILRRHFQNARNAAPISR